MASLTVTFSSSLSSLQHLRLQIGNYDQVENVCSYKAPHPLPSSLGSFRDVDLMRHSLRTSPGSLVGEDVEDVIPGELSPDMDELTQGLHQWCEGHATGMRHALLVCVTKRERMHPEVAKAARGAPEFFFAPYEQQIDVLVEARDCKLQIGVFCKVDCLFFCA